ncbi:conserved protein of unknown function [Legionella pneumophila subsp. pneumophila]|nr:conserved protein of unknown function [Legionella pneumophila subsp. pneumophila]
MFFDYTEEVIFMILILEFIENPQVQRFLILNKQLAGNNNIPFYFLIVYCKLLLQKF